MSYKPEFMVSDVWYDNEQRFATRKEAEGSANARFQVWTMPSDCRAVQSADAVNYVRTESGDELLVQKEAA